MLRCDISVETCDDCVKVRCLFKGKVYVCSKVWLCTSGADSYLKSHPGLYRQLLSRSRSEHLVELINTGKLSLTTGYRIIIPYLYVWVSEFS